MFDKKEYRRRRELGLSGQVKLRHSVTPKGEVVPYLKKVRNEKTRKVELVDAGYPNDQGQRLVAGLGFVNRKQYREKLPHDMDNKMKKQAASVNRRKAKASKVSRVQGGEHERATKKKEEKNDRI